MKLLGKYRTAQEMFQNEKPATLNKIFKHGRPTSRRDFLKSGALQFGATLTLPSIVNVLARTNVAEAQSVDCSNKPTLIGLNLAGGAALLGNFMPLDEGRNLLSNYSRLGHGTGADAASRMVLEFGGACFLDVSQILAGIRATASVATLANTAFFCIPCQNQDDTGTGNSFDFTGLAYKAGLARGKILPGTGIRNNLTGIGQMPALGISPPTPLPVSSVADISNALGVHGSMDILSDSQKGKLFTIINKLNVVQSRGLASSTGGSVLANLINSVTNDNIKLVSSADNGTNPLLDANFGTLLNTIWTNANAQTLQQQNSMTSRETIFANMVYNSLKGNAGSCNLEMGGYDYHGDTRAGTDADDLVCGRTIGQILESAAAMKKDCYLVVTTDGSVSAPDGTPAGGDFTSDSGENGAMYIFAYGVNGRPKTINSKGVPDFQIGHVNSAQAADGNFVTGRSSEKAALAAFYNFLLFSGEGGAFESTAGRPFTASEMDAISLISKAG